MSEYKVHETDLNNVEVNKEIHGETFLVEEVYARTTGRGDPYYDITVSNKFGSCNLKIWSPSTVILSDSFLDLYLKGTEHSKYGKQWRVNHYDKSDYPGDDSFNKEKDPSKLPEMYEFIEMRSFKDYTCQSLFSEFLKLFCEVDSEVTFFNCPADKPYFYKRYGLLTYTYKILNVGSDFVSELEGNKELFTLSALLHHLGSLRCFSLQEFSSRFIPNESYYLEGVQEGTREILTHLYQQCSHKGKPVDATLFKLIKKICSEAFKTSGFSTKEGAILSSLRLGVLGVEEIKRKHKDLEDRFKFKGDSLLINVERIFNEKQEEESNCQSICD